MHRIELARLAPAMAEAGQDFQRIAQKDIYPLVRTVCKIDVLLLWIPRESNVSHRAVTTRPFRDENFFHERSIFLEDLNSIIDAIAHVNQSIVGEFRAVLYGWFVGLNIDDAVWDVTVSFFSYSTKGSD
jgi:hypothetical protein